MTRERTARRRSSEGLGEEYVLFLHGLPPTARWQELKDLAKEYNTVHYRRVDTIEPRHETGFILFAGRKNAKYAFDQFSHHGWRGRSIVVTLNGPIDRSDATTPRLNSLNIVDGPVRSPGSHQYCGQTDLQVVSNGMASWVRRHPSMTQSSVMSHVAPSSPTHITGASGSPSSLSTTHADGPMPYSRHATVTLSQSSTRSVQDDVPPSPYHSNRHPIPVTTTYPPPVPIYTDHPTPLPHPLRSHPTSSAGSRHTLWGQSSAPSTSNATQRPLYHSVHVGGLPFDFTRARAAKVFEQFGRIDPSTVRVQTIAREGGNRKSTSASVTFRDHKAAENAVRELDRRETNYGFLTACFYEDEEDSSLAEASGSGNRDRGTRVRNQTFDDAGTAPLLHNATSRPRRRDSRRDGPQRGEERRVEQERRTQRTTTTTTRGPLVVDGARGNARRRREVRSEVERYAGHDESDSDASDVQREARRRRVNSSSSSGDSGKETPEEDSDENDARDYSQRLTLRTRRA